MTVRSKTERRMRLEQALANTRIEGHEPTAEFLADMDAMIEGALTPDQVRQRIIARAQAADEVAMAAKSQRDGH